MLQHYAYEVLMVALMVFGFGFVVFFHELGHFLAAKWVGIKVEQFAVGFGQALFAWRKGIGWKVGSTHPEYLSRIEKHLAHANPSGAALTAEDLTDEQISKAADELKLGETEYRLNWVPLGGYVKMLGQDDLKANASVSDPRAYNRKSVGQRMIVVSAGVIMNIILAAIGFMVVFLIGFNAPAPVVGKVLINSPADFAGIQVGDRILKIDGTPQPDFSRVVLSTALLKENREIPVEIEHTEPSGAKVTKTVMMRPAKMTDDPKSFLGIGVGPELELRGPPKLEPWQQKQYDEEVAKDKGHSLIDPTLIRPGDVIVGINGQKLNEGGKGEADQTKYGYPILDRALQSGKPVEITVKDKDGKTRTEQVKPQIEQPFGDRKVNVAGMEPRPRVEAIPEKTSVEGKLQAGDVFTAITLTDQDAYPDTQKVRDLALKAGEEGKPLTVAVERDGKTVIVNDLVPKTRIESKGHGLGIGLGMDTAPTVSQVIEGSPAKKAGVPNGAKITAVDGKPVDNWFEVKQLISTPGEHKLTAEVPGAKEPKDFTLAMSQDDVETLGHTLHATAMLNLRDLRVPRQTTNPLTAMWWGVTETRDLILQFYVTIARMFQGSVSYANMMGPLGIVTSGAQFAIRGADWLIWFLAMISANLAVVNFLPIPIVDGGLFTFLILEKIQGKPLSPRAQAIAQMVGFALIISVFLLVTYQDIRRTIGM
jgi:regulator of sigma E protease